VFRQLVFPALERALRHERRFKAAIVVLTVLAAIFLLAAMPGDRLAPIALARRLTRAAGDRLGLEPDRAAIDAENRARRQRDIARTRATYRAFFEHDASPALRRILRAAKMAPDEVLVRWANIDWTVVLSPLVFDADEGGRAYRMRPRTRSFWLQEHTLPRGLTGFLFLPDTTAVSEAVAAAGAPVMAESYQTTNSWGCRGSEPDPNVPWRVLVLGDSFVQGLFVADDQTPPEHLRRYLEGNLGQSVSVLNTGHIGYSLEQYYHTLREYGDRFRPRFVVLSVCPNDFGAARAVLAGSGDWSDARYWLESIRLYCRARRMPCLLVAAPLEIQVLGQRTAGSYPGQVANVWNEAGFFYLDLADPFVTEHLRQMAEAIRGGHYLQHSPLFNGHIHDAHFSPLGARVWGREVGRRLLAIADYKGAGRPTDRPHTPLPAAHPPGYDRRHDGWRDTR
jgi:hypothetical protein